MIYNKELKTIKDLNFKCSAGERLLAIELLKLVKIKAITKLIYNKQIQINGHNRRVDFSFMCNGIEIWIEYNGAQHYTITQYTPTEEKLAIQKQRDKQLRRYARGQKIPLIVYGCEKNDGAYTEYFNNMYITYPNVLKAIHKAVEGKFNYMVNNKKRN